MPPRTSSESCVASAAAPDPVLGDVALAVGELHPRGREREPRVGGDLGLVNRVSQCSTAALEPCSSDVGRSAQTRSPARPTSSAASACWSARLAAAGPRVPGARPAVQAGLDAGLGPVQLGPQHVGEQAVIAEALGGAIERHEREVGAQQVREHVRAAGSLQQRVAQRRGQHVEDRRPPDEQPLVRGEAREHLVAQVLGDEPVAAPEARERRPRHGLVAEREGGEREPGRPALGAAQQRVELVAVELQAGDPQQGARLGPRHGQLGRPELGDQTLGPQAGDRQRQLVARREHDREPVGRLADEPGDRLARGGRASAWTSSRTSTTRPSAALAVASSTARAIDRSRNRGSSWRRSSVTHANGRGSRAHHSHSSVVFPYPAGATRTANGGASAAPRRREQARAAHARAQRRCGRRVNRIGAGAEARGVWPSSWPSGSCAAGRRQGRAQVDQGGACTPAPGVSATRRIPGRRSQAPRHGARPAADPGERHRRGRRQPMRAWHGQLLVRPPYTTSP